MKSNLHTSAKQTSGLMVFATALALMLLNTLTTNAQDNYLTVTTETHKSGKAFEGYMVTVYQDMNGNGDFLPVEQFMANNNKLKFKMNYNSNYMVDFATPADLHYTAQFDTHVIAAKQNEMAKFDIDIDFDKLDVNEYPNTVEMVNFNEKDETFAFKPLVDTKVQQAAVEK